MTLYYDQINNLIVEGTNTKASKLLKKEIDNIDGLFLLIDNYTNNFKSVFYNFEILGIDSDKITANKWCKDHLNEDFTIY